MKKGLMERNDIELATVTPNNPCPSDAMHLRVRLHSLAETDGQIQCNDSSLVGLKMLLSKPGGRRDRREGNSHVGRPRFKMNT
jgi:hypothetical protein